MSVVLTQITTWQSDLQVHAAGLVSGLKVHRNQMVCEGRLEGERGERSNAGRCYALSPPELKWAEMGAVRVFRLAASGDDKGK